MRKTKFQFTVGDQSDKEGTVLNTLRVLVSKTGVKVRIINDAIWEAYVAMDYLSV